MTDKDYNKNRGYLFCLILAVLNISQASIVEIYFNNLTDKTIRYTLTKINTVYLGHSKCTIVKPRKASSVYIELTNADMRSKGYLDIKIEELLGTQNNFSRAVMVSVHFARKQLISTNIYNYETLSCILSPTNSFYHRDSEYKIYLNFKYCRVEPTAAPYAHKQIQIYYRGREEMISHKCLII